MRRRLALLAIPATLLLVLIAQRSRAADDAFYRIPLADLKLDAKIPQPKNDVTWSIRGAALEPQVRPDATSIEAYLDYPNAGQGWAPWEWANARTEGIALVLRAPAGKDLSGRLFVPAEDWSSLIPLHFTVPSSSANDTSREPFYNAKAEHYEALLRRDVPGAAWFRYQANEARKAIGKQPDEAERQVLAQRRHDEFEATYNLSSGGRAISENLQLDRTLLPRKGAPDLTVAIDSLEGITVTAMDWKPLIAGKKPATDPLAALIPADQHAIFFPTFEAAMTLMDEADRQGTPVLQYAEPRAEDARTKQRYQKQMCLSLTGLGRILGPKVIAGVAMTGSDPYLRVGSDVALLLEPKEGADLHKVLETQIGLASAANGAGAAKPASGKLGDITYSGFVSPDRRVCIYLATVGQTEVATNSLAQLQRIVDAHAGKSDPLSSTPEYTFFRDRYARGEAGELGLVVLSDATIRRWCSARWRIGDSRRTRAAAVMADLQARYADELASGKIEPGPLHTDKDITGGLGDLRLGPEGVWSSVYGSLEFMTPIVELDLAKATQAEADTYKRWRDTYQQNWRAYFDPIAVRFSGDSAKGKLAADLTVMPLIANTDYREILSVTQGAKIMPGTGDPHADALLHIALAVNIKSEHVRQAAGWASAMMPQLKVEPLSWVGQTVAFYLDDDPIWTEAAKAERPGEFFKDHFDRIPAAVYIESTSALKLAAFLTGLHAFVDQTVPGMTLWEPLKYNEQDYVKVTPTAKAKGQEKDLANVAIYYSASGGALIITPSESLMKRALDRQAAREAGGAGAAAPAAAADKPQPLPWLGDNYCLQLDGPGLTKLLSGFSTILDSSFASEMQQRAWSNIPILNEWKRRYPDQDPLQVHERLWQVRLIDPSGLPNATYTWNEALQTMESTTYGSPESPKSGPTVPPALNDVKKLNFGVTFENQGLRARGELYRATAK
jgi:hypothetical protein